MRFTNTIMLIAAVSAADDAVASEPSAATTANFASDDAKETASIVFKTSLVGDAKTLGGDFTISSQKSNLDNFKYTVNLKATETTNDCFARYTVMTSGTIAAEAYTTGARNMKADQKNCANDGEAKKLIEKGNLDDGAFNQDDKTYLTTSAKRTQKKTNDVPAIAVTTWSRPLAASPKAAFAELAVDNEFFVSAAWDA